jgi:lactoylglutathione lyase
MTGFHFCMKTDSFDDAAAKLQSDGLPFVQASHPTAPREPREQNWHYVVFRGLDGEQIDLTR